MIFPQFSVEGLPITYVPNPYSADGKPIDSQWKDPVRVHTTGSITLSGLQVIDTVAVMEGDRVLVKDQISPAQNGIYNASSGTWRRANDMYLWEQFVGAVVAVEEGATTNDTVWICQAPAAGTPDVTPNNWIPVSAVSGTLGVFTPLRALVTDAIGNPVASATTAQEIAYVSGVTSSVQQQFNALSNQASSAFSIAVDGTNAAASAQSAAATALSTANSAFSVAQIGTDTGSAAYSYAAQAYALAQIGTNTGTAAYQLAQTGSNIAYDAYAIAVTGTNIGSLAYGLATSIGNKYVRTTRFASIGAGTGGAVALPPNSTVVLDDFGGGVDAVITTISAGYPTFSHAFTAAGAIVTTSFDAGGNYTLSGAPSAYPVALIYRVRQTLSDFDSTSTDIIGEYDVESIDAISGTPNQVYVNGSTSVQFGSITLSLPQDIAPTSTPTFAGLTSTGSVYSPNIDQTTQVAYSGSNVAWAAWMLAQIGTEGGVGEVEAIIGTPNQIYANGTSTVAVGGTVTLTLPQDIGTNSSPTFVDVYSQNIATIENTANSAYFIAEVGTNTGTAAYTLAESGSNVAWAAWVLANAGTELPQAGTAAYDIALQAYALAQIGTNTGTAALAAAATAQSTADSAYFIAQIGTNTGTAAYTLAESGSNVAWSAWVLANAGTELPQSSYDLALSAYHLAQIGTNTGSAAYSVAGAAYALAQIGTNTGTAALAAAATAQSTADSAYSIASIGTNTGSTAYSVAESAWNLAQIGTNTGTAAYSLAQTGSNLAWTAYEIAQAGTAPLSLTNLTDVTLSGPTAQQVLTFTGSYWTNDDVPIVISPSSFNLYLDDTASGTAGYNTLKTVSTGPEVLDAISVTSNNPTPIESYISSFADVTVLPAGIWGFESYVSATSAGRSVVVTTDVYRRSIAGVETYLFSGTTDVFTPVATPTRVIATLSTGSFAVSLTDKLVAKYWFIKSAGGNATFTLYHNGSNHSSYIQTTLGLVHNQLSGLQGGGANEFYHVTLNQNDALVGDGGTPSAANPFSTHQTVAAVQNTADSAFSIAQIGTNTGTAAYNLALANSAVFGVSTFTAGTTLPASPGRRVWLGNTSGGQAVFALPSATNWVGYVVHVKKVSTDGNAVIVRSATGTATIDGVLDQSFTTPYMSLQLTTDGTNWYIL